MDASRRETVPWATILPKETEDFSLDRSVLALILTLAQTRLGFYDMLTL